MIAPVKSIFFAATHRSGSTFLMKHIANTDRLGQPGEYFYPQNFVPLLRNNGLDLNSDVDSWLPLVIEKGKSSNGIFSSKIFGDNVIWLAGSLSTKPWPHSLEAIANLFERYFPDPIFISIRRRDKFRQGLSAYRAIQSGIWYSTDVGRVNPRQVLYDHKEIQYAVDCIHFEEWNLDRLFRLLSVEPLPLYYEKITDNIEETMKLIFDYCGESFPSGAAIPVVQERKLSDSETDLWLERFQRELHNIRHHPQALLISEEYKTGDDPAILDLTVASSSATQAQVVAPFQLQISIRNLHHEPLFFLGNSDGIGDIDLQLNTVDVDSGAECKKVTLPCPYSLESGQSQTLDYTCDLPEDPGQYEIVLVAEQRCPETRELAQSNRLIITVGKSFDRILQDAFDCGAKSPDDWFVSSWFGHIYANDYPWLYSQDHGWLRIFIPDLEDTDSRESEIQFWDSAVGNWSTNQASYPRVRLLGKEDIEFVDSDESNRRFLLVSGAETLYARGIKR
jgi:LPS sulfotransferase NodH